MAKRIMKGRTLDLEFNIDWSRDVDAKINNDRLRDELQQVIDKNILPTIDRGLSPVKGWRMFRKYKDKDRYPGDLKQSNKPNLFLSGDMLSWYDATRVPGPGREFYMGINPSAPREILVRAKANNEGTEGTGGGIAARRFVPIDGESFTSEIVLAIRAAFAKVISEVLKKKG